MDFSNQEISDRMNKSPYQRPQLRNLGSLHRTTQGTIGGVNDSNGPQTTTANMEGTGMMSMT